MVTSANADALRLSWIRALRPVTSPQSIAFWTTETERGRVRRCPTTKVVRRFRDTTQHVANIPVENNWSARIPCAPPECRPAQEDLAIGWRYLTAERGHGPAAHIYRRPRCRLASAGRIAHVR